MKKKLFAALSALTLTGSLLAAPFRVSAAVKVPRVYRVYPAYSDKYLLYDLKNGCSYTDKGVPVPLTQTDTQQALYEDTIYTVDFAEMKVTAPDGTENAELEEMLVQYIKAAQSQFTAKFYVEDEWIFAPGPVRLTADDPLSNDVSKKWFGFRTEAAVIGEWLGDYCYADEYEHGGWDPPEGWVTHRGLYGANNAGECPSPQEYTDTGDVNLDSAFTIADAIMLARAAAEDETLTVSELGLALADMDGDGELTVLDVTESLKILAGTDE